MKSLLIILMSLLVLTTVLSASSYAATAGYALLSGVDYNGLDNYLWPEWTTMKANVIKFQMAYTLGTYYTFNEWHIQKAIDAMYASGATTQVIIFRGPDYQTNAADTNAFLNMRFPDTYRRLVDFVWDYLTVNPSVQFILEVGNEPNFGLSAATARDNLIDTYINCKPSWNFLTNMKWMASVPSQDASDSYFTTFFATGLGNYKLKDLYPIFGAHAYGTMNSWENPNNCYLNTRAMDKTIDATGKHIYVSECNFNGTKDWGSKGSRLKYYFQSWGRKAYVDGWIYWASTTDNAWNSDPFYYGIDRYYGGGGTIPTLPFANQLKTR